MEPLKYDEAPPEVLQRDDGIGEEWARFRRRTTAGIRLARGRCGVNSPISGQLFETRIAIVDKPEGLTTIASFPHFGAVEESS